MAGRDKRADGSAKPANSSAKPANSSAKRANGSTADDAEFEKLLDEMDELGRQADALRAKVNHLIDEMRENDVPPDEEADGVAMNEHDEVVNEADNVTSDNAADGVAVDEEAIGADSDDIAMDADTDPAGKEIDENGEPDAA